MILLIGSEGNMGCRYQAILKYLGHEFECYDTVKPGASLITQVTNARKIIIATPTDSHIQVLYQINEIALDKKDVLCEKPVVKSRRDLGRLKILLKDSPINLFMVNQYQYEPNVIKPGYFEIGRSSYDYYHSGADGLAWDCIQIIALSSEVELKNKSPRWKCNINGWHIARGGVDQMYIDMIQDFLGPMSLCWDMCVIESVTSRILDYYDSAEASPDWNPGEIQFPAPPGKNS